MLVVHAIWFAISRLVTSSFDHAMLLWAGGMALVPVGILVYAFIDVTLHPYYGPHEDPAAAQKRRLGSSESRR